MDHPINYNYPMMSGVVSREQMKKDWMEKFAKVDELIEEGKPMKELTKFRLNTIECYRNEKHN